MSQLTRCIDLMNRNGGEVTCGELARHGLYHKAASRLGLEALKKGYQIEFIKGEDWSKGKYRLIGSPQDSVKSNDNPCFSPFDNTIEELWPNLAKDPFAEFGGMQ